MAHRGPNVCPQCGERVSAFAAGCAICGAELDPHRADRKPNMLDRISFRVGTRITKAGARQQSGR